MALLLPDLGGGGAERVALRLADHFIKVGIDVDLVVAQNSGELRELVPQQVRICDLKASRLRKVVRPLIAYLKNEAPDALIAMMWPMTTLAVIAGKASRSRTRIITADHCPLSRQYTGRKALLMKASMRATYPLAHARIAVSEGVADDIARLAGVARERVEVIYNPSGPLPARMAPDPRIEGLWNVPKGSRIITAGSLDDHKDHALLIRAFAQVTKHRDARLMILGAGSLRGELENLCGALGVGDQVLFPGFVADPWPYLFSASTFALSSKYEGYALVIVEAMHAGLKIVSTDCPSGPAELLQGGRYGTLVGVGDEDALAKALLTALDESSAPEGLPQRVEEVAGDFVLERYAQLAGAVER